MAYTYEDFERAASEAGLGDSFSESDLNLARRYPEYGMSLVSVRRDHNGATTNEQRLLASEAENQLRRNYESLAPTVQAPALSTTANQANETADAFTGAAESGAGSAGAGEAARSYSNEYQRLLDQARRHEDFSYDPESDPMYSAYKKAYNREGDRAAANALAQAAAATGGRVSSYGMTAAQQANNYYAAKLADVIPTLRARAREEFDTDYRQGLSDAETRAAYGDFGGYAELYGPETAAAMYAAWAAQNPQLAYGTGQLTADQYQNLLGGRPLNDGLDANGMRVTPLAGAVPRRTLSDILRDELIEGVRSGTLTPGYAAGINTNF